MVVDDDPDIRDVLCMVLEDAGYRTTTAENGLEALDVLRTADELPAAILLDLTMPVLDGRAFLTAREEEPALAALPIVLMSGRGTDVDAGGAADVLAKPPAVEDILRVVARVIDERVAAFRCAAGAPAALRGRRAPAP
jgi:CheY-like chemotaxis protein